MCQYACFSSKILCVVNLVENRMRVKSLGIAPGLVNARPPGRAKFASPPGTDKAGKCPQERGAGGWVQLELTDALLPGKILF